MLGASQAVLLGCTPPVTLTYDLVVFAFDPDVVSYWKFENNGADEKGSRNASITGSPELGVETIVDLDVNGECIAWPGSSGAFAEAAHHAAHKTAAGTIVVTFQHDSLGQKSTLIAADANAAAGGLSMEVQTDGSPRCFLRRQSDGVPVALVGQPGDVQPNEAYTLIFKWGPAGLSMALWNEDGLLVRRVTDPLGDGVSGTSPIRFGAWHTDTSHHDGPYGRVIWLKRRISDGEEVVLARARTIEHGAPPGQLTQLGAWPLNETSGTHFADSIGGNTASLTVPSWTVATHRHDRRGIVSGTDHALEVSNGGPAIPMISSYQKAEMSLLIYYEPRGELRGSQFWIEDDERYGREFIAHCDDGSTPGSFAIYRKRAAGPLSTSRSWRLGGYIRNGSGTKVYFGDSQAGMVGASLPVDTAKRIVLTQGAGGATLYLDDTEVSNLATVTQGWGALSAPIHIGCSSSTGHANDRSPTWARIDQIEIYQGQLGQPAVQALAPAVQSVIWKVPTTGPLVNITSHGGNVQDAIDAAASVNGFVYQDPSDTTVYMIPANSQITMEPGCRGIVGLRLKHTDIDDFTGNDMIACQGMGAHGDPWAAEGGYKFIGCHFDSNARACDWSAYRDAGAARFGFGYQDGTSTPGQPSMQHHHGIQFGTTGTTAAPRITALVDSCDFVDGIGDAISMFDGSEITATGCRFYGFYRGSYVINNHGNPHCTVISSESHMESRVEATPFWNGCGLCDLEPFFTNPAPEPKRTRFECYDYWCEGDWDDHMAGADGGGYGHYVNVHHITAGLQISPDRNGAVVDDWEAHYCTISYYKTGGTGSGNFPRERLSGSPPSTSGFLFDHCVFLANGREFTYHEFGHNRPETEAISASETCRIQGIATWHGTRIATFKDCELRPLRLHPSMPTGNKMFLDINSGGSKQVHLDGFVIDGAFADKPFDMGGADVHYRNVLHERTGDTTPWTGAGAEFSV